MREPVERRGEGRPSLYSEVTAKIVGELESGRVPWVQPWGRAKAVLGLPRNASSARRYSGINVFILWGAVIERGFAAQAWLTFRQALALGGHVRKGEAGTTVVFADRFVPKDRREGGAAEVGARDASVAFLKRFTVFNVEQCEGLPERVCLGAPPVAEGLIVPAAEALICAAGAKVRIGGDQAYYMPGTDTVHVPPPQAFFEPVNWHKTAFHELGHWTGHASRLNRDQAGSYGSKAYAREELVAEMTSAFVCAAMQIEPTIRHADYLSGWLTLLREDSRAIFRAASAASKAADWLLGFRGDAPRADGAIAEPRDDFDQENSPAAAEQAR